MTRSRRSVWAIERPSPRRAVAGRVQTFQNSAAIRISNPRHQDPQAYLDGRPKPRNIITHLYLLITRSAEPCPVRTGAKNGGVFRAKPVQRRRAHQSPSERLPGTKTC